MIKVLKKMAGRIWQNKKRFFMDGWDIWHDKPESFFRSRRGSRIRSLKRVEIAKVAIYTTLEIERFCENNCNTDLRKAIASECRYHSKEKICGYPFVFNTQGDRVTFFDIKFKSTIAYTLLTPLGSKNGAIPSVSS